MLFFKKLANGANAAVAVVVDFVFGADALL